MIGKRIGKSARERTARGRGKRSMSKLGNKTSDALLVLAGHGNFGRVIAQKMNEIQANKELLPEGVSVRFYMIAEPKEEAREEAKKLGVKVVRDVDELVKEISKTNKKVVAWIATPSSKHITHLEKLAKLHNITIVEKPLTLNERELKDVKRVRNEWAMDLIEEENPAVKTLLDHLKKSGLNVNGGEMEFYRMNSIGIKKLLDPEFRGGIEGGADLDKMVHDAGVAFYLVKNMAGGVKGYKIKGSKVYHYMPADLEGEALLDRWMRKTTKINKNTAVGEGEINAEIRGKGKQKFHVKIVGGWFGVPDEIKSKMNRLAEKIGKDPIWTNPNEVSGYEFPWEELRLFRVKLDTDKGPKEYIGSMLPRGDGFFLFERKGNKWKEIPINEYPADQISRILSSAISAAVGEGELAIDKKTAISSMKTLFKSRRKAENKRKLKSVVLLVKHMARPKKLVSVLRSIKEKKPTKIAARNAVSYINSKVKKK